MPKNSTVQLLPSLSVRRHPWTIYSKIFSSETTKGNYMKHCTDVPSDILHKIVFRFLISPKAWPLWWDNSFSNISPKPLGLAQLWPGKSVQDDEIYLLSNLHFNLMSHGRVKALQWVCLVIFNVISLSYAGLYCNASSTTLILRALWDFDCYPSLNTIVTVGLFGTICILHPNFDLTNLTGVMGLSCIEPLVTLCRYNSSDNNWIDFVKILWDH